MAASCGGGGDASDSSVVKYASCGNTPNYGNDPGMKLLRWKKPFPLNVYVDLSLAPELSNGNNRDIYARAIRNGLSAWTVGNGIGTINYVSSLADADISLKFGTTRSVGEIALTHYIRDGNYPNSYITKGTDILIDVRGIGILAISSAGVLDETTVMQVVRHEMGHALFSAAHSGQRGDVMANFDSPTLSARDINSIREAYCQAL